MDICLESFDYTVVNEGKFENIGKRVDHIINVIREKIRELIKRFSEYIRKIKSKFDEGHRNEKIIDKAVSAFTKNPGKYSDVTIKYMNIETRNQFNDPSALAKKLETFSTWLESFMNDLKAEADDITEDKARSIRINTLTNWISKTFGLNRDEVEQDMAAGVSCNLDLIITTILYGGISKYKDETLDEGHLKDIIKNPLYSSDRLTSKYCEQLTAIYDNLTKTLEKSIDSILVKNKDLINKCESKSIDILKAITNDNLNAVAAASVIGRCIGDYVYSINRVRYACYIAVSKSDKIESGMGDFMTKEESYNFCSIV